MDEDIKMADDVWLDLFCFLHCEVSLITFIKGKLALKISSITYVHVVICCLYIQF